ncbi:unnamed protein product [Sphagnum jensenii]|uniref:HTH myb-type domain-containing protein n=1 Tax=Sphagnum jensenii TaxID=128206 RepID=A0ABP0XA10_9BRYO
MKSCFVVAEEEEQQQQQAEKEKNNAPSPLLSQPPLFSVFESEGPDCVVVDALEVESLVTVDDDGGSNAVVVAAAAAAPEQVAIHNDAPHVDDVQIAECFEFVSTSAGCGLDSEQEGGECEDIDVSECLDFVQGGAAEDVSECLDSSPPQAAAVAAAGGVVVGGGLLDGGESISQCYSGECSSGEKKEERNHRTGGGSKNAAAATAATASGGKKKAKVDWTPELHRRFVQAVEQLGVEKAFPSRILELMGVQCLTRHNIASHLQKYRSHRRHLAAREAEAASWSHNRRPYCNNTHHHPSSWSRSRRTEGSLPYLVPIHTNSPPPIQPRPSAAAPHMVSSHAHHQMQQPQPLMTPPPLKVWGYPTVDHSPVHMWQQSAMSPPSFWQAPDGSYWQHPAACYDASSHPPACYPHPMRVPMATMPSSTGALLQAGFSSDQDSFFADEALPTSMYLCCNSYESSDIGRAAGAAACSNPPSESHLSKEILDAAISEALANPWTPPPLGLKPPSMEGVIAELQRQGINTVPPSTC